MIETSVIPRFNNYDRNKRLITLFIIEFLTFIYDRVKCVIILHILPCVFVMIKVTKAYLIVINFNLTITKLLL